MSTELEENLREGKMSAREGRERNGLGWAGLGQEKREAVAAVLEDGANWNWIGLVGS
jgi:hypothetical protein